MDNSIEDHHNPNSPDTELRSQTLTITEKFFADGYQITATFKNPGSLTANLNQDAETSSPGITPVAPIAEPIFPGAQSVFPTGQSFRTPFAPNKETIQKEVERLLIEILLLEALYLNNRGSGSIDPSNSYQPEFNPSEIKSSPNQIESSPTFTPGDYTYGFGGVPMSSGGYYEPQYNFGHAGHLPLSHSARSIFHVPGNLYKSLAHGAKTLAGDAGNIVNEARHNLGRPVWALTKFASLCQYGNLGCAATVSELLQESGVSIAGSASVAGVVNELANLGWHKIRISDKHQFHTGDVVFGLKGSHGHIGIISQVNDNNILVCDNSSSSGTLKERSIESGGSFTPNGRFAGNLYVMRRNT